MHVCQIETALIEMGTSSSSFVSTCNFLYQTPLQNLDSTFCSMSCRAQSLLIVLLLTWSACSCVKPLATTAGLYPRPVCFETSASDNRGASLPSARLYTLQTTAPPRPRLCCKHALVCSTARLVAQPRRCQTSSAHW